MEVVVVRVCGGGGGEGGRGGARRRRAIIKPERVIDATRRQVARPAVVEAGTENWKLPMFDCLMKYARLALEAVTMGSCSDPGAGPHA